MGVSIESMDLLGHVGPEDLWGADVGGLIIKNAQLSPNILSTGEPVKIPAGVILRYPASFTETLEIHKGAVEWAVLKEFVRQSQSITMPDTTLYINSQKRGDIFLLRSASTAVTAICRAFHETHGFRMNVVPDSEGMGNAVLNREIMPPGQSIPVLSKVLYLYNPAEI